MSRSCKETLCTSCIHLNVCSIKDDYLKILDTLPKYADDFDLTLHCKHYSESVTNKFHNILNYGTTTGNPCGSKIDI